jgi:hypothetical protein
MLRYCGAKNRKGEPCQRVAGKNGRCANHGGLSTGAKTPEGKLRQKMASWKTGQHSKEAIAERKAFRAMVKQYNGDLEGLL